MQFHLKTLLIVVTCAALAAAALAPWFRSLDEVTQARLLLTMGIVVVATLVNTCLFAAFGWGERLQAGRCWKSLQTQLSWHWIVVLCGVLPVIPQIWLVANSVRRGVANGSSFTATLLDGLPMILILSFQLPYLISVAHSTKISFHENGWVQGLFVSRTRIRSWRWSRDALTIVLTNYARRDILVPNEDRAGIEKIMQRWSEANVTSDDEPRINWHLTRIAPLIVFVVPMLLLSWQMFAPSPAPVRAPRPRAPAVVAPVTGQNSP